LRTLGMQASDLVTKYREYSLTPSTEHQSFGCVWCGAGLSDCVCGFFDFESASMPTSYNHSGNLSMAGLRDADVWSRSREFANHCPQNTNRPAVLGAELGCSTVPALVDFGSSSTSYTPVRCYEGALSTLWYCCLCSNYHFYVVSTRCCQCEHDVCENCNMEWNRYV
jgi:hypothetical protein